MWTQCHQLPDNNFWRYATRDRSAGPGLQWPNMWLRNLYSAVRIRWHTRRNQISSFGETGESMWLGGGDSSIDYLQPSSEGQLVAFVLCWTDCAPRCCKACWTLTPFSCYPFTCPPSRRRVPCRINRALLQMDVYLWRNMIALPT
jgi:hypothetical protein